ncbi:DUF2849 domain-containing protein [Saccharibacter sp. 17.LH.SD]|uniref:DUF2849 domain-containing protein n=1 Tax=Saccharibacter sp. 17.LH.SD TaxID=2689393 RepID=UPI00136B30DD|nr:DUF2849 domain-containing protein [Saccharibacter sp. 17.LH.SD]MXV45093.1 DUF2849 domain-containing protein [Saccharibacter sp. 17.LH.SD]
MKRLSRPGPGETLLLTATRLLDGRIVWRDAAGIWQEHVGKAAQMTLEEAEPALEKAQETAVSQGVMGVYVVLAHEGHPPQPVTMKEHIRAFGPSVHPEFAYSSTSLSQSEASS